MTYEEEVAHWFSRYLAVGWAPIITQYGEKTPLRKKNWQADRPTQDDLAAALAAGPVNLGVLCGAPSNGLLGIDPDTPEMRVACALGLPPTPCTITRDGITHPIRYLYAITGDMPGPFTLKDPTGKGDEATLVDLLWTGRQTIVPPSLHPDGSHYGWGSFGAPPMHAGSAVAARVAWCGAAALLARYHPDGGRHDVTLAVAGGLLVAGWSTDDAEAWMRVYLTAAGDDELDDRIRTLYDTADRIALGKEAVGFTRLKDYIDPRVVRKVCDWLGITEDKRAARLQLADDLRCTDEGNAERFATLFGDQARYVPELKRWLFWDGIRWAPEGRRSVLTLAVETVKSIHLEAAAADTKDKRVTLANWAVDSESVRRLTAIGLIAQALPSLRAPIADFDADPWVLNTPSGVLDLRTFKVADHDPADLHQLVTAASYDPTATCPRYDQFLLEVFEGDQLVIDFVQRAAGLSLTGVIRDEVFFLCYGDGGNGKSKLLGSWRDTLGDYAGTTAFSTFDGEANRGGVGDDLAILRGKRFITAIETDQERRLAEAKVKRVTGGDPVSCRKLYGEYFEYVPTYKLWLAINTKPVIRGTDHGIWRRVLVVPFHHRFEGAERNLDIDLALREERDGILRWMVDGLRAYHERGLDPPDCVKVAVEEYRKEMNLLADFVSENCIAEEAAVTPTRELYLRYSYWSKDYGEKQLSHRAFSIQLRRLGYEPWASNGVRYWRGLRLRPESFTAALNGVGSMSTVPAS